MKIFKKISYNSPVILTFALISLAALGLNYLTDGYTNNLFFVTRSTSLADPLMYVRLFTHVLGHANLEHYVGNMTLILLLGPMLEEKYGSRNILMCILITALVTGLINNIFFQTGLLGASGIVFMMIIMSSMTSFKNGTIPLTLILVVVIYLGQEVYNALFVSDNIAQFAHIIGGLCGAVLGFYLTKNKNI